MKKVEKILKNKEKTSKNHKFADILEKISVFFDKFLFPDDIKCIFCGKDIPSFYEKPYCENCEKHINFNTGNRCLICDMPIKNEAKICDFCQNMKRYFKKAYCPLIYKDIVRQSILSYKFDNKRYLAKGFAVIISNYIKDLKVDLITFVPMTRKREKERSFNQSERLAKELGKLLNIKVVKTLEKIKDTDDQKSLTFKERSENLKDAFRLINRDLIKDKNVLLVDDILTTCATINTCAEYLSKYSTVYVTAIARNCLD